MLSCLTNRSPLPLEAEQIIGGYFPVLDHGFVALKDVMGSDDAIEEAARLSYQAGTRATSKTRGLLRYLYRNRHTTPFEMVELKFHVSMPIFIARQWIRHRMASVNEVSGRYSLLPMLFYTPEREHFKLQSGSNKQGRDGNAPDDLFRFVTNYWQTHRNAAAQAYESMAALDLARELARIDLPLSTYTQWYWKIDLHNLFNFLRLRAHSHAQYEIQAYARVIAGMVARVAPLAFEAWLDYEVCGARMSRMEMEVLRSVLLSRTVRMGSAADGEDTDKREVYITARYSQALGTTESYMQKLGMSQREITELHQKLQPQGIPDFTLDLRDMKDANYFEERMRAATPSLDVPEDA